MTTKHRWRLGPNESISYEFNPIRDFWYCFYGPTGQHGIGETKEQSLAALYELIRLKGIRHWKTWGPNEDDCRYIFKKSP